MTTTRMGRWLMLLTVCGCGMPSLEEQTQKSPSSIIGKKTQEIGQFDPNSGSKVSDGKINATDPATAALSAYGPMLEKISTSYIEAALNLFKANEDRYPNDYDEFMEKIIKDNRIQFPVLPGGKRYQYDVENHKWVVVDAVVKVNP